MKGLVDIHCHLLPEVDDGAASFKEALKLLQEEQKNQVAKVILTPHFRRGVFDAALETKKQNFRRFQAAAKKYAISVELYLGCEYHADREMLSRLAADAAYRLNGSRYVLSEFKTQGRYSQLRDTIYQLRSEGYIPIVAHVERYECIRREPARLEELRQLGAQLQLSAAAVLGRQGFGLKRFCHKLLKADQVHYIASDAHDLQSRPVNLQECARHLEKKYSAEVARQLLITNPEKILTERKSQ